MGRRCHVGRRITYACPPACEILERERDWCRCDRHRATHQSVNSRNPSSRIHLNGSSASCSLPGLTLTRPDERVDIPPKIDHNPVDGPDHSSCCTPLKYSYHLKVLERQTSCKQRIDITGAASIEGENTVSNGDLTSINQMSSPWEGKRKEKKRTEDPRWNNGGICVSFRSVLGPSSTFFSGHPNPGHELLSERTSDYYHYGSHKHHKGKSKSDKKHAILSALTLLAFLFFLNILQNCIREQNLNRGTLMMFTPTGGATAPTGHQAKDPNVDLKSPENPLRKKRTASEQPSRKSRTLLGLNEPPPEAARRQVKFIRNFSSVNNWTRELSQMTEKELQEQKLKTLNFPLYWKNNRFGSMELRPASPVLKNGSSVLRKFKKRERTGTESEPRSNNTQKSWDYKKPEKFQPSPYIPETPNTNRYTPNNTPAKKNMTATPHLTLNAPTTTDSGATHFATTPRNRRSDYSTPRPDYDEYDRYGEQTDVQMSPTPAMGLDLNTFQTFPVYNYYNHRTNPYRENQTETTEPTTPEIDRMHNEVVRVTTPQPLFHPTKTSPAYAKPPQYKYRNRYPVHHGHYHRNHYPAESRYRYSPYRKTGAYETPHFHDHVHDDYYPPVVLAKYEVQHDEPGFDLMKFLWAMVTSFAKPLTRLVPTFAKDNADEAQCYDLLVCEAQRVSRFMGPTAEALATTVGTLLTWAATEETRQIVVDAINSGRENTCQQQIRDCEDRSGGKSTMTMIAQVLEMKLR